MIADNITFNLYDGASTRPERREKQKTEVTRKKKKSFRVNSFSPQKTRRERNKHRVLFPHGIEAKDIQNGSLTLETHALFTWKRNS